MTHEICSSDGCQYAGLLGEVDSLHGVIVARNVEIEQLRSKIWLAADLLRDQPGPVAASLLAILTPSPADPDIDGIIPEPGASVCEAKKDD
jgi:hypothetical protein